ncbi:MAG: helix-turn-helix domain-containing protein [Thermoguttaceae bacterium]
MKERLKELRKKLNLTQRELAEKIGVKISQISDWERGRFSLSAARIAQICAALNVRREWFETGEGDVLEPQRPEKRTRDEILSDAFELVYNELSDDGKKACDKVLERLFEERMHYFCMKAKRQTNNGTIGGDMIQN